MLQSLRSRLLPQRTFGLSIALLLLRLCVGVGLFQAGTDKLRQLGGECATDPLPTCEAQGQAICGEDAACKTQVPARCLQDRQAACVDRGHKAIESFASSTLFGHEGWKLPGSGKVNFSLVAVQEALFGLLLAFGLLARPSAVPILAVMSMVCATSFGKPADPALAESSRLAWCYFAMAATLLAAGPGRFSIDALWATQAGGANSAKAAAKPAAQPAKKAKTA